ncbi:hypothetical protein [Rhodococcus sp. NPDC058521]
MFELGTTRSGSKRSRSNNRYLHRSQVVAVGHGGQRNPTPRNLPRRRGY